MLLVPNILFLFAAAYTLHIPISTDKLALHEMLAEYYSHFSALANSINHLHKFGSGGGGGGGGGGASVIL